MKKSLYILLFILGLAQLSEAQSTEFPIDKMYAYEYNGNKIFTKAQRQSGPSYKVEFMRVPFFDEKDPGIEMFRKHYGDLVVEHWKNHDEYVLLLGNFTNRDKANQLRARLVKDGFQDAKIIEYSDGLRN